MIETLKQECTVCFSRSSGPGGQNVNKLNTRATVKWSLPETSLLDEVQKQRFLALFGSRLTKDQEVTIHSDSHRVQSRNLADSYSKLMLMIEEAKVEPKLRKKTKPSRSAVQKGVQKQKQKAEKKRLRMKVIA